jgi:hypothetical protein
MNRCDKCGGIKDVSRNLLSYEFHCTCVEMPEKVETISNEHVPSGACGYTGVLGCTGVFGRSGVYGVTGISGVPTRVNKRIVWE